MSQSSCRVSDSMLPLFDMKSVFNNIKSPFSETKLAKFSILKQNSVMEGDSSMTFKSVEHNRNIVTKLLSGKVVVCQKNLQQNVSMFNESVLDDDMCTEKMNNETKNTLPSLISQKRVISKSHSSRPLVNNLFGSDSKRMYSPIKEVDNISLNCLHKDVDTCLVQKSSKVSVAVQPLGKTVLSEKKSGKIVSGPVRDACKNHEMVSEDSKIIFSKDSKIISS